MLQSSPVSTRLPAQDLARARRFYSEKLGLDAVEERPGGLLYRCGGTTFALFTSSGRSSGTHTQMGWEVTDIEATVATLRARGVVFEEYDLPGLKTVNGIADIQGNYPSKGIVGAALRMSIWCRSLIFLARLSILVPPSRRLSKAQHRFRRDCEGVAHEISHGNVCVLARGPAANRGAGAGSDTHRVSRDGAS
jgi:catechol 2,3-dioxygenase-like lactoylglutathione lyase family enzyme